MRILALTIGLLFSTTLLSQGSVETSNVVHIGVKDNETGEFLFGDPVHTRSEIIIHPEYVIVDGRKCIAYSSDVNSKRVIVDCKWDDGTNSRVMLTNDSEYNYTISVMSEAMIEIYELD